MSIKPYVDKSKDLEIIIEAYKIIVLELTKVNDAINMASSKKILENIQTKIAKETSNDSKDISVRAAAGEILERKIKLHPHPV